MLSGQLLRSGNLRDFTALGGVGYPVYSAAAQIRTAVAKQLGQEYADFLAVPQFDSKGEAIDWYAAVDGDIVPWAAASETERAFMRQRLQEISGKIEAHARQIQENPRSNDQAVFGKLLALSTRIPDESHIYLINGKPLVTFWGFVPAGSDTNKHVLADLPMGTSVPPAASVAAVEPARRSFWRWLLPLLLLLLLLLILMFSLRSCEVLQPYVPLLPQAVQDIVRDPDAVPPDTVAPDQVVPGGAINGTMVVPDGSDGTVVPGEGTLDGDVPADGTAPDATAPDAASPDAPNPDETAPDQSGTPPGDAQQPDDAAQDQTPPQPDNPADPNATDPNAADAANTPPIKPIDIPDRASQQGDPSFMQGDWRSKTGLTSKNSKTPVTIDYSFDKSGKGTTTLRMQDGVSCSGPSSTSTSNGKMTIQDDGQLTCSNGKSFAGSKVECVKDANKQTKCTGRYPNGQTYDITLGR